MSDFLLELAANPRAAKVVKSLGLPIPLPQPLRREQGPYGPRPLDGMAVVLGGAPQRTILPAIAAPLCEAGAEPMLFGEARNDAGHFREPGEAFGRPARILEEALPEELRPDALVFDASGIAAPGGLRALYDFFHPLVGALARCGRALVLARPVADAGTAEEAAARAALEGFVRSLAKEIGRRGATAQLLEVAPGAEGRLAGPVRFFLSPRSAFITGQPVAIDARAEAPPEPPPYVRPLEGKVALVTGAARGIGAATARRLAEEGAKVVCLDRPEDDQPVSQVAREVGGEVLLCDVAAPDAPETIAAALADRHGGVDIIVHNAGVTRDKTLARMSPEQWDQAIAINLDAVARISRRLIDGPLRDRGRIVCLSSVAGIAGNVGQTNYAASKAGIIGWIGPVARALAGRGVTVNAIAPGFIETRLTAAIPTVIREVGRRLSALGQGGLPIDVAEAITFLATPGAAGITGRVLRVCGGALIGK